VRKNALNRLISANLEAFANLHLCFRRTIVSTEVGTPSCRCRRKPDALGAVQMYSWLWGVYSTHSELNPCAFGLRETLYQFYIIPVIVLFHFNCPFRLVFLSTFCTLRLLRTLKRFPSLRGFTILEGIFPENNEKESTVKMVRRDIGRPSAFLSGGVAPNWQIEMQFGSKL
jgi:hypothetical protein